MDYSNIGQWMVAGGTEPHGCQTPFRHFGRNDWTRLNYFGMIPFVQAKPVRSSAMKRNTFNNRITKSGFGLWLSFEIVKGFHRKKDRVYAE
jgi:hypothetical protein